MKRIEQEMQKMQRIKKMQKMQKMQKTRGIQKNKKMHKIKDFLFFLFASLLMITTSPVFADLPTPPQNDIANSTKDWVDVGGSLIYKVIGYCCYALGALILVGVAATVLKSFHTAHEKQDLGHFFKTLIVGLIAAAIGIGLVYAGNQIIPTQQG